MKTAKLVIGIISLVLFVIIALQSCAAGVSNALEENGELSGSAGLILGICMVIAGIVGIATRNGGKGGAYTAAGFYAAGGLLGIFNAGSYSDLYIWSGISIIFALVFFIGTKRSSGKHE